MRRRFVAFLLLLTVAALVLAGAVHAQAVQVDAKLPAYTPIQGVSGNIKSVGSDTMNNLMALWTEGFMSIYPNIQVEIEGKGSSTAPPALISGAASFGPMSRMMKSAELDAFERIHGYKPTQLPTAIDMLAVYVHKDNPIQGLSFRQLDAIFSKTRKGGHAKDIRIWGDVGLTGKGANFPITLYGRNSASGTYGYFKKHALYKGDFKDSVKEQPGSSAVVAAVAGDLGGIGYSGIGYRTADVRVLPICKKGTDYVPATAENAYKGAYPLSRFLYLAVNYKPGSQLDPLRREFLRYVYTREGQKVVVKDGYLPVSAAIGGKALAEVGITSGP